MRSAAASIAAEATLLSACSAESGAGAAFAARQTGAAASAGTATAHAVQSAQQAHAIPWPYEKTLSEAFSTFETVFAAAGGEYLSEGAHDVAWLRKQLEL